MVGSLSTIVPISEGFITGEISPAENIEHINLAAPYDGILESLVELVWDASWE